MKKNNLFKVIGISVLVAALLTWIFKVSYYDSGFVTDTRYQVGIFDLFQYGLYSFRYFANIFLFIVVVGGFYGVLKVTGVYGKLVNGIVDGFKGKEKLFLIITMILLAVICSVVGMDFGLFMVFPLLISIILGMKFNKLTALTSTVGAVIIGLFGSIFSSNMFSSSNSAFGLTYTSEILGKIVLLVLGLALLIAFTLWNLKKAPKKKGKAKSKNIEEKDDTALELMVEPDKDNKKKVWPLVVILDAMLIVILLGTIGWSSVFNISLFETVHTAVINFEVFGFPIFGKILGGVTALGTWTTDQYCILMLITSLIIALVYKVKFSQYLEAFGKGAKKLLLPAILTTLIFTIVIISVYNPITLTIENFIIGSASKFSVIRHSLGYMIGSVLNVDMYYYAQNVLPYLSSVISSENLSLANLMFVNLYGLMMLIAPVSAILVATLAYTKTSYTKWIKHIWKLFVALLIVSLIVFLIIYKI